MVRSLRYLLFVLALAAPLSALAQAGVAVAPYSLTGTGATATSLQGMAVYEASAASTAANARYYQRAVSFASTTMSNGARSRLALGPAAALSAAMLAAGWALDELTGQIQPLPDPDYVPLPDGVYGWGNSSYGCPGSPDNGYQGCYGSANAAADVLCPDTPSEYDCKTYVLRWVYNASFPGNGYAYFVDRYDDNGTYLGSLYVYPNYEAGATPYGATEPENATTTPAAPVSDADLWEMIRTNPQVWPEILHNPNGTPRVFEPMPQQMKEVQDQYRADTGMEPLPAGTPEPIPAPEAVPQTGPYPTEEPVPAGTSSPPAAGAGGNGEFPGFCTWASVVCEFLEWVRTEPPNELEEPELPVHELSLDEVEYDAGLGQGVCPPPVVFNVYGTHEMSFEPFCEFAGYASIFVRISALILSCFLIMKVFG